MFINKTLYYIKAWVHFHKACAASYTFIFFSKRLFYLNIFILNILFCFQDSSTVTPVTLRVDPQGFFLYWTDQNKVKLFKSIQVKTLNNENDVMCYFCVL